MQWAKENEQTTKYNTLHKKTKDRAKPGVNSDAQEGYSVPAPYVVPVV
jgi:hypothetical protein